MKDQHTNVMIFRKEYHDMELCDLERDVMESFGDRFNPLAKVADDIKDKNLNDYYLVTIRLIQYKDDKR
jgi:hypothetical protein